MAERPDLVDPVPQDEPLPGDLPGDDIPETPDVIDPEVPEDPNRVPKL